MQAPGKKEPDGRNILSLNTNKQCTINQSARTCISMEQASSIYSMASVLLLGSMLCSQSLFAKRVRQQYQDKNPCPRRNVRSQSVKYARLLLKEGRFSSRKAETGSKFFGMGSRLQHRQLSRAEMIDITCTTYTSMQGQGGYFSPRRSQIYINKRLASKVNDEYLHAGNRKHNEPHPPGPLCIKSQ